MYIVLLSSIQNPIPTILYHILRNAYQIFHYTDVAPMGLYFFGYRFLHKYRPYRAEDSLNRG